jgi:hypothetical protein
MDNERYYTENGPNGQPVTVTVIYVNPNQLNGLEAERTHNIDGTWTICVSNQAGPEVLAWEMNAIAEGQTWDKI